jgi:hypothetical protein
MNEKNVHKVNMDCLIRAPTTGTGEVRHCFSKQRIVGSQFNLTGAAAPMTPDRKEDIFETYT